MSLSAADYRPRDAEHAVLYRVIDEHLEAFLETAAQHADGDRKSTRLNSSHIQKSRMPSSA